MQKNIPVKSLIPDMLNTIDYNKLMARQANGNQSHNNNKEIKGRSLTLNKKLNNYHNKTF